MHKYFRGGDPGRGPRGDAARATSGLAAGWQSCGGAAMFGEGRGAALLAPAGRRAWRGPGSLSGGATVIE